MRSSDIGYHLCKVYIKLGVEISADVELVEPLQKSCIWRQARGSATEISGIDDGLGSIDKASVAQQWYDELDDLAAPKPETEMVVEDDNLNNNLVVDDKKICINCCVCNSLGTSESKLFSSVAVLN
ncbi:uncharacterized protein DS421_20g704170 [Arachis hypogaea]|nr:uncharacterized protein DS421_20g704170 [Arachis hypogaea]